ncbi:MAG: hypothetical protein P8Z50_07040 [candidate division WOR-3 bacterium]
MNKKIILYFLGLIFFVGFLVFGVLSQQRLDTEYRGSLICFSCIGID